MIKIVTEPIQPQDILESVQDPSAGAIDIFIGTTRNHSHGQSVLALEYEAYSPMALKMMYRIADEAKARYGITKISIVHRIGRLEVGESSVVIAVSSTHRREAFEACRFAIDALKTTVPIWKKEFFADGESWVDDQINPQ